MPVHYCSKCGEPLAAGEGVCHRCGEPASEQPPDASGPVFVPAAEPPEDMPKPRRRPRRLDEAALRGTPFEPVGLSGWMGIIALMLLPGVNIVLLIIWASGGCRKYTKRNFARAALIFIFFGLVIFLVMWLLLGDFWQRYLDILYYYW